MPMWISYGTQPDSNPSRGHRWLASPEAAQFTVSAAFASRVAVPSMAFTLQPGRVVVGASLGGKVAQWWLIGG